MQHKSSLIETFFKGHETQEGLYKDGILRLKQEWGGLITDILVWEKDGILYLHQLHPEKLFPLYIATIGDNGKIVWQIQSRKTTLYQFFIDIDGKNQLFTGEQAKDRRRINKENEYSEEKYRGYPFKKTQEDFEEPKTLQNKVEAETLLYIAKQLFKMLRQ